MKKRILLSAIAIGLLLTAPSGAQQAPQASSASLMRRDVTSTEENAIDRDLAKLSLQKARQASGKSPAELKALDIADSSALVASVQLPCEVTDAALLLEGSEKLNSTTVKTKTYEVACSNGQGYFVVGRGKAAQPAAMTCFAAQATYDADVKEHRPRNLLCALPANKDAKTLAANLLAGAHKTCAVRETRWIGLNGKGNIDFSEVACNDGNGFIVASSLPGATLKPQVVACRESALQGLPCKLSDNGKIITVQTFKDVLVQKQVACDVTDVRVIGKQSMTKRHVVEFACKQRPEGLVAFIPLEDSTAPFETADCAAAAKLGAVCKLTVAK